MVNPGAAGVTAACPRTVEFRLRHRHDAAGRCPGAAARLPPPLAAKVRALLERQDDYTAPGKPACDWDDRAAPEELVDALVGDAYRAHDALRGEHLDALLAEAAALLATVTGQDIQETPSGRFQMVDGTAPDRISSTVDPAARHGHKTAAHGFDGYKAHIAVDPDSEVICAAEVSPAAVGDAAVAPTPLGDLVGRPGPGPGEAGHPGGGLRRQRLRHRHPPGLARPAGVHADGADGEDASPDRTWRSVRQSPVPDS